MLLFEMYFVVINYDWIDDLTSIEYNCNEIEVKGKTILFNCYEEYIICKIFLELFLRVEIDSSLSQFVRQARVP